MWERASALDDIKPRRAFPQSMSPHLYIDAGQAGDLSHRVRLKRWDNFAICILIFSFFIEIDVYKGFSTASRNFSSLSAASEGEPSNLSPSFLYSGVNIFITRVGEP